MRPLWFVRANGRRKAWTGATICLASRERRLTVRERFGRLWIPAGRNGTESASWYVEFFLPLPGNRVLGWWLQGPPGAER